MDKHITKDRINVKKIVATFLYFYFLFF